MNKKVSVIIVSHDRPALLKRAIKSVVSDSWRPLEIVLVDNLSTTPLMKPEPPEGVEIKLIRTDSYLNASASRNVGIDNATGDYITFLDDDDYYLKDKITRQAAMLENNPHADFCIINYVSQDADGGTRVCGLHTLEDMVPLMRWVPVHTNSLFLRAPVARKVKFNEKLNKFTDLHVTFRLFENYKPIKAPGEGSVFERSNRPDQITNTSFVRRLKDVGRNYRNWKIICEDFAHIIDKSDILRDVYYRRMATYAAASGKPGEALHYALAWRGKRNIARPDGIPRYAAPAE